MKDICKTQTFSKKIKVYQEDSDSYYIGDIDVITSDLHILVKNSDYIFIMYPSFLFPNLSKETIPLLDNHKHLFFIPGSGGVEFFFSKAIAKGITIIGLQRVHCVARVIEAGMIVKESGVKDGIKASSIPLL